MESKMKFWKKFAFGLGDFGGNFCFSFISSFPVILGSLLIVCFLFMNVEEENKKLWEAI